MVRILSQFYEDDIYGFVKFRDTKQNDHGTKAQPAHIKILTEMTRADRQTIRRAIADDINGDSNE